MKRANADAVERAVAGPDFEGALALINGRVADAKEAQSQASGRASQAWADIEKLGVNKRGAQMFVRIQNIEDADEQQDQLRTFFKLCELEGIGLAVDLVDQAQGRNANPVPTQKAKAEPDVQAEAPTEAGEKLEANPKPKPRGGKPNLSVVDAKAQAQQHLGSNTDAMS